jgi:tryptophan halogenase
LAAGFVEPLESTAIHLITKGVKAFLNLFPDRHCNPELAREYNRIMYNDYEGIRDFIVLHYCTTARDDTAFWRWCRREMKVPETLRERMALFRAQGRLRDNPGELFKAPSWHSVFLGMGVIPESYDPLIDHTDLAQVNRIMDQVRNLMTEMARGLPAHSQYLKAL